MKEFTSLFLSFGVSLASMHSCCKEADPEPATHTPHGLWVGTYTVDQEPAQPPLYYSFILKTDGMLLAEGKGGNGATYYSTGNWNLLGDSLKASYTTINYPGPQVTQSAKFVFDSGTGTVSSGTWKDGANGSNYTGKFPTMVKVE